MLISRSTGLFGLSIKPALFIDAGRSIGTDGAASTSILNSVNNSSSSDIGINPKIKYNGLNGKKTLNYDANKRAIVTCTVSAGSVTLIAVTKRTNASSDWFFMEHGIDTASASGCYMYEEGTGSMGFRQGGQTAFGVPSSQASWRASAGTWYTRITRCNHGAQTFNTRLNGTNLATSNGVPSNWGTAVGHLSNFFLGARNGAILNFRGECAFALMYNGYLTDAQCELVEKLLRLRFKHY